MLSRRDPSEYSSRAKLPAFSGPLFITVTFTVFTRFFQAFAALLCDTFIACTPRSAENLASVVLSAGVSLVVLPAGTSLVVLSQDVSLVVLSEDMSSVVSPADPLSVVLSAGVSSVLSPEDDVVYSAVRIPRTLL